MRPLDEQRRRVVVTGSVAFDYLMTFPGVFVEHFVPDRLNRISVSFLVDEMRRVPGGCAPNIAYGLSLLGIRPTLLATAGADAGEYKAWLSEQGVDVGPFRLFDDVFTASFFVNTDRRQNQIASFYTGAMARASTLSVNDVDPGSVALVVVSPNDPSAMVKYAEECRTLGVPFLYDPSQQVARLSGEELVDGMTGAAALIVNEYEYGILERKTSLTEAEMLQRTPILIITKGEEGALITVSDGEPAGRGGPDRLRVYRIPVAALRGEAVDPTGVGDAFRAGLISGRLKGASWETAGRMGAVSAVFALESLGPQPARYGWEAFRQRFVENFGEAGDLPG